MWRQRDGEYGKAIGGQEDEEVEVDEVKCGEICRLIANGGEVIEYELLIR